MDYEESLMTKAAWYYYFEEMTQQQVAQLMGISLNRTISFTFAIGSALAGSLSMVFGCALRAPHGGIFVFPVVDHALLYVVALIVGSVVGAVILSLLKKEYVEE